MDSILDIFTNDNVISAIAGGLVVIVLLGFSQLEKLVRKTPTLIDDKIFDAVKAKLKEEVKEDIKVEVKKEVKKTNA